MPLNRKYKYKITVDGIERIELEDGEIEEPPKEDTGETEESGDLR